MPHGYPECDLCPQTNCDENDTVVKEVLEDADFVKNFANNMLNQNLEEIANDCYLMAEVVSGKTSPVEIADFGYCIYVALSQTIEMDADKRMEIAVVFREEFDKIIDKVSQERAVARKPAARPPESTPVPTAPVVTTRPASPVAKPVAPPEEPGEEIESTDDFLKQLDEDIAEIEAISGKVDEMIASPALQKPSPVHPPPRPAKLEPVIQKLSTPTKAPPAPAPASPAGFFQPASVKTPAAGSKSDPIKLTKDMLQEMVAPKDLSRIDKGMKIKRGSTTRGSLSAPPQAPPPDISSGRAGGSLFETLRGPAPGGKPSPQRGGAGTDEVHVLDFSGDDEPDAPSIPPPPSKGGGLTFVDPLAGIGTVAAPRREERVILCHECKELNPPTNKYCKKCGFALVP